MLLALHASGSRNAAKPLGWAERCATALRSLVGAPARFVRHRRLLATMAQMSDIELTDIGLTRLDIGDATALPLGSDPSALFKARVKERVEAADR